MTNATSIIAADHLVIEWGNTDTAPMALTPLRKHTSSKVLSGRY